MHDYNSSHSISNTMPALYPDIHRADGDRAISFRFAIAKERERERESTLVLLSTRFINYVISFSEP